MTNRRANFEVYLLPVRCGGDVLSKREFTVADEQHYNREGPVRWVLSHLARYPVLPVINLVAAVFNNFFYSYIQILIGRGFDLINSAG